MWNKNSKEATRSPLKESPLRLPGQSLEAKRERLVDDVLLPYFPFPTVFWIVAVVECGLAQPLTDL